jgi:hypothetical protein
MKIWDAEQDDNGRMAEAKERERRARREATRLLTEAVHTASVERFDAAIELIEIATCNFWPALCRWAGRKFEVVPSEVQDAFLSMYVQRKQIAFEIDDPAALTRLCRVFLPTKYDGPALDVYRGASRREMQTGRYGVSWTTDPAVAEEFAVQSKRRGAAVVLKATAEPWAILLVRANLGSFDESEVIVDPSMLGNIIATKTLETNSIST